MDVTAYLKTYSLSAKELAAKIIQDVLIKTGITAAAGIGTNLYLCKVAMDIVAKHVARLPCKLDKGKILYSPALVKRFHEVQYNCVYFSRQQQFYVKILGLLPRRHRDL